MTDTLDPVTEHTDVHVVSLTDRRKIRALELQVENLTRDLEEARGAVKPVLNRMRGQCFHSGRFEVADHEPSITCKQCGAVVDPFLVLRKIATRELNFSYQLNALRAEHKELTEAVAKLKGQRTRQRAAVSKATPDVPWADVVAAMKLATAESVLVREITRGQWAAWFYTGKAIVVSAGPCGTAREAIAELVTRSIANAGKANTKEST